MAEINPTQLRSAVAWSTGTPQAEAEDDKSAWEWFWEAIQGDFNENRSTGQIVADAAISMIPLVDQVCDVRDLVANCKKLRQEPDDMWSWVALALTLIGLFPVLGSLVKGVLKVFFSYVRRGASKGFSLAVDASMTCVVALLRRETCQHYLRRLKVDDVFAWLAKEIKQVKAKTNPGTLLRAFDKGVNTTQALVAKVQHIPRVGTKAKAALDTIVWVRGKADEGLRKACGPIDEILDAIIMRLGKESLRLRHGIINVKNVHYRGGIPEAAAVTQMRNSNPKPSWLSTGQNLKFPSQKVNVERQRVEEKVKEGWPSLSDDNIESFHKMASVSIKGPTRLFRIISPNSRAMSDCWISEKVFNEIQNSPDPKAAWRKILAVWPDWNGNGQFVVYDVKPGETLKAWQGPAAGQKKEMLPDHHLEGGGEQIVFKIDRADPRNDTTKFYKRTGEDNEYLTQSIDRATYEKIEKSERDQYVEIRESINHPNISGPFETGWDYTEFGGAGFSQRIGLPSLPGQTTQINN
ncbi:hypothetical protein [Massilia arenae]|uniref:hypothetical protein n=1 Tax=Massilia arenae TaxID=2603288 RepID=UPI00164F9B3B|nr:hypothetical protein [Massilia arenae]